MNKFWIQRCVRLLFLTAVLGTVGFSVAFAEMESQKSEAAKIDPNDIQKALTQAGFYHGAIDGVIGKKTRAAIREFQTENGLTVDGVCGPKTWEKLKTHLEGVTETTTETTVGTTAEPPLETLPEGTDSQEAFDPALEEGAATSSDYGLEAQPKADDLKQKMVS